MQTRTDDLRVKGLHPPDFTAEMKQAIPVSEAAAGPCFRPARPSAGSCSRRTAGCCWWPAPASIHDEKGALEYPSACWRCSRRSACPLHRHAGLL